MYRAAVYARVKMHIEENRKKTRTKSVVITKPVLRQPSNSYTVYEFPPLDLVKKMNPRRVKKVKPAKQSCMCNIF